MKPNIITSLNKPKNLLFLICALIIAELFLLSYASRIKPAPEEEPKIVTTTFEDPPPEEKPKEAAPPAPTINLDSIHLDSALKDAIRVAQNTITTQNKFTKRYNLNLKDSSEWVVIDMEMGHLFSSEQQHLLLRRHTHDETYLDIFELKNWQFKGALRGVKSELSYLRDTIFDVNGDGAKDFLVHTYPPSGCCLRDVYNVYLHQAAQGTFAERQEFVNPTFSPREKIIRGIGYGYPEHNLPLYKKRWNGWKAEPVERITHNYKVRGQFFKVKHSINEPTTKDSIILNALPREYQNLENLNWFMYY